MCDSPVRVQTGARLTCAGSTAALFAVVVVFVSSAASIGELFTVTCRVVVEPARMCCSAGTHVRLHTAAF